MVDLSIVVCKCLPEGIPLLNLKMAIEIVSFPSNNGGLDLSTVPQFGSLRVARWSATHARKSGLPTITGNASGGNLAATKI